MGPFCLEQGTSSYDTFMELASTDEMVTLLTDEVGAVDNVRKDNNCELVLF